MLANNLLLIAALGAAPIARDAPALFESGRKLVQRNFGDAYGATREGLEQGVSDLLAAERAGYPDRKAIYLLIADAYNSLSWAHNRDEAEKAQFLIKEREAYLTVMRLYPRDVQSRLRYASTAYEDDEALQAYRDVLKLAPGHATAHYGVGMILAKQGQLDEAVPHLRKAVESFGEQELGAFGDRVVRELKRHGRVRDAQDIDQIVKRRKGKAPRD